MNKDANDTKKASLILIGWALLVFIGLFVIDDPRYGMTLVGAATGGLALIIYSSWLIERTERRMQRYIDNANERIKQEQTRSYNCVYCPHCGAKLNRRYPDETVA